LWVLKDNSATPRPLNVTGMKRVQKGNQKNKIHEKGFNLTGKGIFLMSGGKANQKAGGTNLHIRQGLSVKGGKKGSRQQWAFTHASQGTKFQEQVGEGDGGRSKGGGPKGRMKKFKEKEKGVNGEK